MKKIRIGNDIRVEWKIRVNGGGLKLSELKGTSLELRDRLGNKRCVDFIIENEAVVFEWRGTEQKHAGKYTLTFWANIGAEGQAVVDCCDFVELVYCSCRSDARCADLNVSESISIDGDLALGVQGKSAYQIWLDNGHEGTESEFLEWLRLPSTEAAGSAAYISEIEETNDIRI